MYSDPANVKGHKEECRHELCLTTVGENTKVGEGGETIDQGNNKEW